MKNWQGAEDYCVGDQGHLVSIHSQEELSFLMGGWLTDQFTCWNLIDFVEAIMFGLFPTAHMPGAAWVGLNDIREEEQFEYTDGSQYVSDYAVNIIVWYRSQVAQETNISKHLVKNITLDTHAAV